MDPVDVTKLTMEELRARRAEAQEIEVGLSYLRRLAQGRLDIVASEVRRRAEGGEPLDSESLVAGLSDILGDNIMAPGNGRMPRLLGPNLEELDSSRLDDIAGPGKLAAIGDAPEGDVARLIEQLSAYEAEVSVERRVVHERIDALQAEITRRYKTGEASVESLLK